MGSDSEDEDDDETTHLEEGQMEELPALQPLSSASPLAFLSYLYLYIEPHDKQEQLTARHKLAYLTLQPQDRLARLKISKSSFINSTLRRFGVASPCFHVKVSMDIDALPAGCVNSVLQLSSPLSSTLSCTTSIYSYGEKILETKESHSRGRRPEHNSLNTYRFNFLHEYWTAFLNGFQFLSSEEQVSTALESVTMIQIFHVENATGAMAPLLCLAYEFEAGIGNVTVREAQMD